MCPGLVDQSNGVHEESPSTAQTDSNPKTHAQEMKSLMSAFAHHGKPLRGLMSTPKSVSFEGRFGRMFTLPQARYGEPEEKSRKALKALGDVGAMTAGFDAPKDGIDGEESGIPALYTYFGQFIDHDITFDPMSTLQKHFDPNALTDFRTPALDLDNVYGRGPDDQPYLYDGTGLQFELGKALKNGAHDLPRNGGARARALIGDPRNDENSIISQLQGLMLQFHNRVAADHPHLNHPSDFHELQRIVRWHYQWVIAYDFLPRIISEDVLKSLKTDARYDQSKICYFKWRNNPFMPVEFSAAAYRLGHSMIRPGYRLNEDDATLLPIFPVKKKDDPDGHPAFPNGLTGFTAMEDNRGIDWKLFIDIGPERSNGTDPDKDPNNPDNKKRLQFAYKLDPSIVNPLSELPTTVASDDPQSLAQRNLLRGFELGLPSGQAVAKKMGVTYTRSDGKTFTGPLTDDDIWISKNGDDPKDATMADRIKNDSTKDKLWAGFKGNCPLWTYILAEAAFIQRNAKDAKGDEGFEVVIPVKEATPVGTPQLGPVGGRIVAEVFLGLLFGDKSSFFTCDPHWTPTIFGKGAGFKLKDIVAYALGDMTAPPRTA